MLRLTARRLLSGLVTIWVVTTLIFLVTEILPGDVAEAVLGKDASPESVAAMRERLQLDRPIVVRYAEWLGNSLRGDLGTSLAPGELPVATVIGDHFRNSLWLASLAASLSVPLSLLLGFFCAAHAGSPADRGVATVAICAISVPEFFIGVVLVYVFAVQLHWFPALASVRSDQSTSAFLKSIMLPAVTLALSLTPHLVRLIRNTLLNVLSFPFIEMAVLMGVPRYRIILSHALPNALGPIITIVALVLAWLVSGVVVIETVFAYPGLGRLMVDAVAIRDMPVIQACALIFSVTYIGVNILADVLAILSNPRLRYQQ